LQASPPAGGLQSLHNDARRRLGHYRDDATNTTQQRRYSLRTTMQ